MAKVTKRKNNRVKTYRVIPYNIHIKGPVLNKGYQKLFNRIKKNLLSGELVTSPNSKGVVLRCMSGEDIENLNATRVRILKYNSKATGLAWDLAKEELIKNTKLVSAQVVDGIFYHDLHIFVLIPKSHGPSDREMEEYIKKIFKESASPLKDDYIVDTNVFKQSGSYERIEEWDVIKSLQIEVYRNNPINNEVGNNLAELADLLTSDKIEIKAKSSFSDGISKEGSAPLIEGADRLSQNGQGRIIAEGVLDGHKDFIDTNESKSRRIFVKSKQDDENGLFGKIKESLNKLLGK